MKLIIAIALPDSATYHFKPKKLSVDVCATKQFEDCENGCFDFFSFLEGKQQNKKVRIFFNISWKMTAKCQDTRMGLQSGWTKVTDPHCWQTDRPLVGTDRKTISHLKNRFVTFNIFTLVT